MLEVLRTHSRNWLIYLLFGAIIIVFSINFGPGFDQLGQTGCQLGRATAAKVNGERIPSRLFIIEWQNFVQQYRIPKQMQSYYLKKRSLEKIIRRYILSYAAEVYGIVMSDEEVEKEIFNDPSFQEEGVFSPELFKRAASYYGLTPDEFGNYIRVGLQAARFQQLAANALTISEEEIKITFFQKREKVTLNFATIPIDKLPLNVEIPLAELKSYIEKNKDKLKEYFKQNPQQFRTPAKVRISQIAFLIEPNAKPEQIEKKKKELEKVLEEAKKNPEKFAELAKKYSQSPDKEKGGDMGYFEEGKMPFKEMEKVAFSLKKGQVSGIIKTPFGLHIIKVTDKKPQTKQKFEDPKVQEKIAKILLEKEKRASVAKKVAKELLELLKKGKEFKEAVNIVADKYASAGSGSTTKPSANPTTKAGKATTKPADSKFAHWLRDLKWQLSEPFSRESEQISSTADRGELIYPLIREAFKLTKENPLPKSPLTIGDKIYIFKLKKRSSKKRLQKEFENEKRELKKRYLQLRQFEYTELLYKYYKEQSKVRINEALLKAKGY